MICPICKRSISPRPGSVPDRFSPFCSDRCKLIDLGRWLGGKYQIPVIDTDEAHDGEIGGEIGRDGIGPDDADSKV
ncbi:MAG TPA: DNA gyrase inhibitor YacG [Tepidisphaeraceae bacterium]|nr:DNA gyrase inhibitor YacG [Tepidisphaeraceae bacterium]